MKTLWIGDMHFRRADLLEADSIIDQLIATIKSDKPDLVILSGDQFDTFGVILSDILAKWTRFFNEASRLTRIIALVGNHDMAGADGGVSAMEPFKSYHNVTIVDKEYSIISGAGNVVFLPFMRSTQEFEATVKTLPANSILFCHQSFNGAQFENGFYDPHGADVESVKHLKGVISGHVHKQQAIQNILYPGTPRQLTFSDAGETKAIFTIALSRTGYEITKQHVLNVPKFELIEGDSIDQLLSKVSTTTPSSMTHYKFIAKGTPSEIADFWNNDQVKQFKSKAKRVVDALTSMKPITAFLQVKGQTQSEKLDGYIKGRTWRTGADKLIERARQFLTAN